MAEFYMKVAGVTHEGREAIIRKLQSGDSLYFMPEPTNPYDNHAVRIYTSDDRCIGFIPREHNYQIFENLIHNKGQYSVHVSAITGGGFGSHYGCNIVVDYQPNRMPFQSNSSFRGNTVNRNPLEKIKLASIKKVLICPECGESVEDNMGMCQVCGCPMDYIISNQIDRSGQYKCIECGAWVSIHSDICPECGCPIEYIKKAQEDIIVVCPECGANISSNQKSCPECGYPIQFK